MTTNDAFERNLSTWLHEDAEHHVPDHLAEVLQRTATARQRPAWSTLERWLPVDSTFRHPCSPGPCRCGRWRSSCSSACSSERSWHSPLARRQTAGAFGLARNGMLVTSRDGDIYLLDQTTHESRLAVGRHGFDFSPIFSRDGTRMVFLRSDVPLASNEIAILTLYVANADGSEIRALTPPTKSLDWFDWSPDGTRDRLHGAGRLVGRRRRRWQAATTSGRRAGRISRHGCHRTAGRSSTAARPRARGSSRSHADGTSPPRPLSKTIANNRFDFQSIAASPDGASISFTRWSLGGSARVFAIKSRRAGDGLPDGGRHRSAGGVVYSPDGNLVAYAQIFANGLSARRRERGRNRQRTTDRSEEARPGGQVRSRQLGVHARRDGAVRPLRD